MTTLTPTREEQSEITRFGLFDEDVLRQMEEHADDTITCHEGDAPATWRFSIRCCEKSAFLCDAHAEECREDDRQDRPRRSGLRCRHCGHRFPASATFAEIIREVRL